MRIADAIEKDAMDTDHDVFCLRGAFLSRKAKEFFVRDERERVMETTIISRPRVLLSMADTKLEFIRSYFSHGSCREHVCGAPLCAPRGRKAARARHLRWLLVCVRFLILGFL